MMDQTKSEEHGIVRNSVNDNVNKQLYQVYRFVISLEDTNNQSIADTSSSSPFTLQQLYAFNQRLILESSSVKVLCSALPIYSIF